MTSAYCQCPLWLPRDLPILSVGCGFRELPVNEDPLPNDHKLAAGAWNGRKSWEDEEVTATDVAVDSLAFLNRKTMRYDDRSSADGREIHSDRTMLTVDAVTHHRDQLFARLELFQWETNLLHADAVVRVVPETRLELVITYR